MGKAVETIRTNFRPKIFPSEGLSFPSPENMLLNQHPPDHRTSHDLCGRTDNDYGLQFGKKKIYIITYMKGSYLYRASNGHGTTAAIGGQHVVGRWYRRPLSMRRDTTTPVPSPSVPAALTMRRPTVTIGVATRHDGKIQKEQKQKKKKIDTYGQRYLRRTTVRRQWCKIGTVNDKATSGRRLAGARGHSGARAIYLENGSDGRRTNTKFFRR